MAELQKKVLLIQLSGEQQKLWQVALASQQIGVMLESPTADIVESLEHMRETGQILPDIVLMDIGITTTNSASLQARNVCRWCADYQPDLKVILTNPREDQIKSVGLRWATRQGAIDLLPRLYRDTIMSAVTKVMQALDVNPLQQPLQELEASLYDNQVEVGETDSQIKNIREAATAELVRKMALIPLVVMAPSEETSDGDQEAIPDNISLGSTVGELLLYDFTIDIDSPGLTAGNAFKDNPLLPGIILTENSQFLGMISRQRFLDYMSRPYALELFSKRPLRVLYESAQTEILVMPSNTLVVTGANQCLKRSPELIYEPIVVQSENTVGKLLDIHDLFVTQSQIHELATKLLREQTQARMVETEKMAGLGQMVAEVSHDIANPVNTIYNNLRYLSDYSNGLMSLLLAYEEETTNPSERVTEIKDATNIEFALEDLPKVIASITKGAEQLKKIVSGLETFAQIDESASNDVNVNDCLETSLTILSNRLESHISVIKTLRDLPQITGFQGQLVQVFVNIISNAIDALTAKAATAQDWQPEIGISTEIFDDQEQTWVLVKITDNGPGIPQAAQAKIFELFFNAKEAGKGTGLGLSTSHQIITQNHKGKISLRSPWTSTSDAAIAGGTEFQILLPLSS